MKIADDALFEGNHLAERFLRKMAAATRPAPSMQRIDVVEPLRSPVIGLDIEPETSSTST